MPFMPILKNVHPYVTQGEPGPSGQCHRAVTEPMALATGLCGASFSRKRPDTRTFGSQRSPPT